MRRFAQQYRGLLAAAAFLLFLLISRAAHYEPGQAVASNFATFLVGMLKVLPCVFVLIGLFDVWVPRATVERHLGEEAGSLSYLWAVLLAGTAVGGLHVALPLAQALRVKGARLSVMLTFISCAGICRIPMTLFEASFLGWRFTAVRFAVSLPLVVLLSAALGKGLERPEHRERGPRVASKDRSGI